MVNILTDYGPIQGCKKMSLLGRSYFSFQRIPYMKAPIGKLRYVDPQPPEKWIKPLDCSEQGQAFCNVNFLTQQYEGDLDAMFINIYTNCIVPRYSYPVMVWVSHDQNTVWVFKRLHSKLIFQIHGGGIFSGNARTEFYGPDYFMQKDVVVVTFQYRMGVFGFLSLDDPSLNIPGNAQFRDHIFALHWIQRNIAQFGGDPNNVTLFGESWGGGSTNYHMLSEKSKGLFHRGILMSGSALNGVYSTIPKRKWAERLCIQMGYDGPVDDKSLLEFLESADPKELVLASSKIVTFKEMAEENILFPFGPTIESYDNGNIFITGSIVDMSRNCWGNGIDIMIGATSNECSMIEALAAIEEEYQKITNFNRYLPYELGLENDEETRSKIGKVLMRNYYGVLKPTKTSMEGVMHAMNDNAMWHPITRVVRSRELSGRGSKSFVYRFDIDSNNNLFKKAWNVNQNYREPTHGDDVCYLFKSNIGPSPALESPGFEGIKLMLSVFTEFAWHGNPNVQELGEVEWEPATFDQPLRGININEQQCEITEFPEAERVKIFDEIFIELKKDLY